MTIGRWRMVWALAAALFFGALDLRAEENAALAEALGVRFVPGSATTVVLEREGRQYIVDLASQTIAESGPIAAVAATFQPAPAVQTTPSGAAIFQQQCASCHGPEGRGNSAMGLLSFADATLRPVMTNSAVAATIRTGKSGTAMPAFAGRLSEAELGNVASYVLSIAASTQQTAGEVNLYEAADDYVYSVPTGRALPAKSLYVNFTHRFAYSPAFQGPGLSNTLFGMDGFSLSSFGFRYGVTDELSVSAFRSPSLVGRPIELTAAYNFLEERSGAPVTAAVRVSLSGQDHFARNFTTSFEGVFARSLSRHAQLYAAPTLSLNARQLITKPGSQPSEPPALPGIDTFSVGAGLTVNIRPTLALIAEATPTLVNGPDLGIHRPSYAFGIQKRVRGHAFTFAVSNGPGVIVAQRAGTRATLMNDPQADTPRGLFLGFNLMRRLR